MAFRETNLPVYISHLLLHGHWWKIVQKVYKSGKDKRSAAIQMNGEAPGGFILVPFLPSLCYQMHCILLFNTRSSYILDKQSTSAWNQIQD